MRADDVVAELASLGFEHAGEEHGWETWHHPQGVDATFITPNPNVVYFASLRCADGEDDLRNVCAYNYGSFYLAFQNARDGRV